ncbi:hypothetical protein AAHC03_09761 [Spirometra sp. Aus1]
MILPWLPSIIVQFCDQDANVRNVREFIYTTVMGITDLKAMSARDASLIGGITSSVLSISQYLSSPLSGALSDTYGRIPVLLCLHILGIVSYMMWAVSGASFLLFLISRLLNGAARANVAVLSAMVSDISGKEMRTRGMAVVGAAYSVAYLVGPTASAVLLGPLLGLSGPGGLGALGPQLGLVAALISALNILFLFCLSESAPRKPPMQPQTKDSASTTSTGQSVISRVGSSLLLNPSALFSFQSIASQTVRDCLRKLAFINFAHMLLFAGLECNLLYLAQSRFGYTSKDQGRIFLFVGISMAVIQGGFIRRFKGGREAETLVASILSQAVAYLVIGLAPSEIPFYIGMLFYSFTSAAFVPAFNGLTSLKVPSDQQGQAMGKLRSINALARAFGPSAVSILFWIFGPAVSFAIAAALTVSVAVSFRRLSYS